MGTKALDLFRQFVMIGPLILCMSAHATTWEVNELTDNNPGACTAASCELRNAVAAAQPGDVITFSTLFSTPQTITLGAQLNITKDLEIRGPGIANLSLTCPNTIAMKVSAPSSNFFVKDLTFVNCTSAVDLDSGAAQIERVRIIGSSFLAIYFIGTKLYVIDSEISNSFQAIGAQANFITIRNSLFSNNDIGVRFKALHGSIFTITKSTFSGNRDNAIYTLQEDSTGTPQLNIINTIVSGNRVSNNRLAAVASGTRGMDVNVIDSEITDNTGTDFSAGLYAIRGRLRVIRTTISGNAIINSFNSGNTGGAIDCESCTSVEITNSTISGNSVPTQYTNAAGGVWTNSNDVRISNSTITNNSGAATATTNALGLLLQPTQTTANIRIQSNIIAGNVYQNGLPDVRLGGAAVATVSQGYNLIGNSIGTNFNAPFDQIGTIQQPQQPLLIPLANNGGMTRTHALAENSPAIDQGNAFLSVFDQRSFNRTVDVAGNNNASDGTDVGAFEALAVSELYFADGLE